MIRISSALLLLSLSFAGAQTVDEIIAKNIQARGGLDKLKAVKTVRMTAKINQNGFRATVVQENQRPNKVREEFIIQGMAEVEAYDGKSAWQVSPFEGRKDASLLSADDTKHLIEDADVDGQLVDYKNKDHRAELMGRDSVEGTDCYKIKLSMANGDVRYYYIDTDTFLDLKVETERNIRGSVQYGETLLGDYEQVNGVYYPFSVDSGEKGSQFHTRLTVEKVEINVPLDATRFSIPAGGAK
ncbi:MAG TPA: outer membrane lipoprotein-sorting protein [Bryobacteraceae bacterium]|nr:outer membrane lipoprotein-sorting protein [Bryobacteraceae bacterium]